MKPNLHIIGFGMPAQECRFQENWEILDVNVPLTAGTPFDYLLGGVVPHHSATEIGLE